MDKRQGHLHGRHELRDTGRIVCHIAGAGRRCEQKFNEGDDEVTTKDRHLKSLMWYDGLNVVFYPLKQKQR